MKKTLTAVAISFIAAHAATHNALVLQTDFGLKDGAVSAMQGVAFGVDNNIKIFNLTHEIPAYNVWEASYRLLQTAPYWPKGTVFVSVVDPGVGTDRKSVVLKTKSGHFFVTPDNGTLTLVADHLGIDEIREIDEKTNRLKGSEKSYTFHGRDVYAYTGAKLASGALDFSKVGKKLPNTVEKIDYQKAVLANGVLKGTIPILDIQYGNIWSNISSDLLEKSGIKKDDTLCVEIDHTENGINTTLYQGKMPYKNSFGEVSDGQPLVYLNSLLNVSVALNMDSFAQKYHIGSGANWNISLQKCN